MAKLSRKPRNGSRKSHGGPWSSITHDEKLYSEMAKEAENAVARNNAEADRIFEVPIAQPSDHAASVELNLSRATALGIGAFINALGITVTREVDPSIIPDAPPEWVNVDAILSLINKNRGDETSEAYLKRLIDNDNARKNPPKSEEVKPAIRQLDLED